MKLDDLGSGFLGVHRRLPLGIVVFVDEPDVSGQLAP